MAKPRHEGPGSPRGKTAAQVGTKSSRKDTLRPSPITGRPMEHLQLNGITVDRCRDTGGIWLDAGELSQVIEAAKKIDRTTGQRWLKKFFNGLLE